MSFVSRSLMLALVPPLPSALAGFACELLTRFVSSR